MNLIQIRKNMFIIIVSDWYLSSDGQDTPSCGDSASNACGTLDWLLDRFYQTSYKINPILSLITDSGLTIDQNIVLSIPVIEQILLL